MRNPLKGVRPSRKNAYLWVLMRYRRNKPYAFAYPRRVYRNLREANHAGHVYSLMCDTTEYRPMHLGLALQALELYAD